MDPTLLHDIMKNLRYKSKKNSKEILEYDPVGAFSQITDGVLVVEDVRYHIH